MGQRSQVVIEYDNGKRVFAEHLQWAWAEFLVFRAFQLVDYIQKSLNDEYGVFSREELNRGNGARIAKSVLKFLTDADLPVGSYVEGSNLLEDFYAEDLFTLDVKNFDNNDGVLVIKVFEKTVKYAFVDHAHLQEQNPYLFLQTAEQYLAGYDVSTRDCKKNYLSAAKMAKKLSKTTLLTPEEVRTIFETPRHIEDC